MEKLSEKGHEQCSDRGFGRRTEAKMELKAPPWRSAGLRRGRVRGFSDSLWKKNSAKFAVRGFSEVRAFEFARVGIVAFVTSLFA